MRITTIGAAGGEVTGSCYSVQTKEARILVDCGLFQGGKKSEALNRPPTTPNRRLDAVLLTHGHLDHSVRLPDQRAPLVRLIQQRYRLPSKLPKMGESIEL